MVALPYLLPYLPELTLLVATFVVFLLDVAGEHRRTTLGGVSAFFLIVAFVEVLADLGTWPFHALSTLPASWNGTAQGPILFTSLGIVFQGIFLAIAALVAIASLSEAEDPDGTPTFYALLLLASLGMLLVAISGDLILLLLAVEVTGISTYVLVGYTRKDRRALEAAMKFYIIGAFSTTISFFGASLVFGAYGTTSLLAFSQVPSDPSLALVGFAMIAVGLGFKVTLVPFHMWAVDVYDGAPAVVSAYLSAGSKKMGLFALFAIFVGAVRVFDTAGNGYALAIMMGGLAIATMTVGNVLALQQQTMKRMLAYSSISQAGYMLIGLAVNTTPSLSAATLQMVANVLMKGGAFVAVAAAAAIGVGPLITDWKGLGHRRPILSASFAIMLLSMAGIPLTLGFVGKFYLFFSAILAGGLFAILAIVGLLNSAISVFYYARILKHIYMPEETGSPDAHGGTRSLASSTLGSSTSPTDPQPSVAISEFRAMGYARMGVIVACAVLLIALGIYPTPIVTALNAAAHQFVALH